MMPSPIYAAQTQPVRICNARVRGARQYASPQRKLEYLRPSARHGSWKWKEPRSLLERVPCGDKLEIVVAHHHHLARIGFELSQWSVEASDIRIRVLNAVAHNPTKERETKVLTSCAPAPTASPDSAVTDTKSWKTRIFPTMAQRQSMVLQNQTIGLLRKGSRPAAGVVAHSSQESHHHRSSKLVPIGKSSLGAHTKQLPECASQQR